jgi:hypothetical protein
MKQARSESCGLVFVCFFYFFVLFFYFYFFILFFIFIFLSSRNRWPSGQALLVGACPRAHFAA